ncbi:MAG: hypothetical protein ACREGE_01440 [Candidatus Microsaccharimonas sp.]
MFDEEYGFDTVPHREPSFAWKIVGWTIIALCSAGIVAAAVMAVPILADW